MHRLFSALLSAPLVLAVFVAACANPPAAVSPDAQRVGGGEDGASSTPKEEAVSASPTPGGGQRVIPQNKCTKNLDCVLSTFSQCCACCPGVPHAYAKDQLEALEASCTVRCRSCDGDCGPPIDLDTYAARCIDSHCVALPQ